MEWSHLDNAIPWVRPKLDDLHSQPTEVDTGNGWVVRVLQPGLHWKDTYKPGGDFVIRVDSSAAGWTDRAFMHSEVFEDIDEKRRVNSAYMEDVFAPSLIAVVAEGADSRVFFPKVSRGDLPGVEPEALLVASQALALAEHRRYRKYEPTGGRCLPTRFAVGIIFGRWSAVSATRVHRSGLRGLNRLRREAGSREPSFQEVLGRKLTGGACNEPRAR